MDDIRAAADALGLVLLGRPPVEGELYLAGRNGPVYLLTCRKVCDTYICANGTYYAYDTYECHAVREA